MTNISALLHFLVWIEIQKYHFRCVPTLVDLWVYLVDVWSSHIWWPFANGLVSQMSRHLHCFNARVVPEELSNRRMVPLFRFLFSCVFFQPEFVGPFFHHVREGVPYQSYPKSRVWPLPGFFLKDLSIYTQRWSFITKKWYFPTKGYARKNTFFFFGRCSLRPRVSRVDGWQKSNMVNFAPDSHRLANDICMDGCVNSKVAMNNSYGYTKYILWFLLCASVTQMLNIISITITVSDRLTLCTIAWHFPWKETQFYLQVSSINVDRARFSRSTFYYITKQLQHVLFSAVKTVGWCSFSQTKFI